LIAEKWADAMENPAPLANPGCWPCPGGTRPSRPRASPIWRQAASPPSGQIPVHIFDRPGGCPPPPTPLFCGSGPENGLLLLPPPRLPIPCLPHPSSPQLSGRPANASRGAPGPIGQPATRVAAAGLALGGPFGGRPGWCPFVGRCVAAPQPAFQPGHSWPGGFLGETIANFTKRLPITHDRDKPDALKARFRVTNYLNVGAAKGPQQRPHSQKLKRDVARQISEGQDRRPN